jgi:hypothetical protein
MGLVFGVLIGGGSFAGAAKPVNIGVDDYSQCTDGLVDGPDPPNFLECTGWINGILNTNNSTYHEDEVTPQRLVVSGLAEGSHTFLLRYLIKKADAHAYDSLATWNYTQEDADPCQGLTGQVKSACDSVVGDGSSPQDTIDIPDDTQGVPSACNDPADTSANTITANHQLDGQQFEMWGGTLDDLTPPAYQGTFTDSEGVYRSILVTFNTVGTNSRVFFYFGGHLAAGANTGNPSSPRGWGEDCGAGSINGGPYHIKLDGIDGASAGNRDNQIMSGAVLLLPPLASDISTAPSSSTSFTVTLNDSLDTGVADAGGTATFKLYGPFPSGTTTFTCDDTAVTGNLLWSGENITVNNATGTASTNSTTGTGSKDVSPTSTSIYTWVVDYAGDATHVPPVLGDTSDCGDETSTVTPPTDPVHVP